jgi:hypothetical protein
MVLINLLSAFLSEISLAVVSGITTAFQNALFANAEGRSFNCFIKMPFKQGAKIQVVNESSKKFTTYLF